MIILDKYIGRTVALGVLSVMLVLAALNTLIAFAGEFSAIGQANYTFWYALGYTILRIPRQMYELFPLATLLGTMLGLGTLAKNSELVVIRSAGVSVVRVAGSIMKTGVLLIIVAIIIGEVIAPPAQQYAKLKRVKMMEAQISLNTDYGLWARDGLTFINVRRVENDGMLVGISLYTFNESHQLKTHIHAASARHDGEQWLLHDVTRSDIGVAEVKSTPVGDMKWKTILNPSLINVVSVSPDDLSFWRLYRYIDYLHDNGLDAAHYELALWTKIVMPLTIAVMVLLALPFSFASTRNVSIGRQIVLGFLVGLTFYIANRLLGQMGIVYNFHPAIGASLPTLIVMGGAFYVLRRIR